MTAGLVSRKGVDPQWVERGFESPLEMRGVLGAVGSFEERKMQSTGENPGTSLPSCHLEKLKEENLNVI